jgi:hypothetical protein
MEQKLIDAYKWQRESLTGRPWPVFKAYDALALARADVAAGRTRYPTRYFARVSWQPDKPRHGFVEDLTAAGLREVGRVEANGRDIWDKHGRSGWYTAPCCTGLAWGVVYQLPGHKGTSRFVAGYVMNIDNGPVVDLSQVYVEPRGHGDRWNVSPQDLDAARTAARAADSMAKHAAEEESEYQAAWQAGNRYADLGEEIAVDRAKIIALCRERREAMRVNARLNAGVSGDSPAWSCNAICAAIRESVTSALERVQEARRTRAMLQSGEYVSEYLPGFYGASPRLQSAFQDGASR